MAPNLWVVPDQGGAFDAFPVFDSRPIFRACEEAFPGRGTNLSNAWRTRKFEYQWLRAIFGRRPSVRSTLLRIP
jgi:hypothetical protein